MAIYEEPGPEMRAKYAEWLATRPANVRAVAERLVPWELYRMKTTGQRCTVDKYAEELDGRVTLTVTIRAAVTPMAAFDYGVFGVDPDDLEACDVPTDGGWGEV